MLTNYLKIAVRNLLRHKLYSLINILGLAIGMAVCLLILLWVQDELSYDRYHENAAQVYRIALDGQMPDRVLRAPATPGGLAPALRQEVPEVVAATRIAWAENLVSTGKESFYEKRFFLADPEVFEVFTFPFVEGDPASALEALNSVVLTETAARKYFGDEDPLGRTIRVNNDKEYAITGVLKDLPGNAHFRFDFLASFSTLEIEKESLGYWTNHNYATYLRLREGTDPALVTDKIDAIVDRRIGETLKMASARPWALRQSAS